MKRTSKVLLCSLAAFIFVGIFAEMPQQPESSIDNLSQAKINKTLFFEEEAWKSLANIRENTGKQIIDLPVSVFLWSAFCSGHDLKYFETSGADLYKALCASWVHEAKEYFWKASTRCRYEDVEFEIKFMLMNLAKAGMKPCDIGVSDELVKKILRFGYYSATVSQIIRAVNAPNHELFLEETKGVCYYFKRLTRKDVFRDDKNLFLIEPFSYLGVKRSVL